MVWSEVWEPGIDKLLILAITISSFNGIQGKAINFSSSFLFYQWHNGESHIYLPDKGVSEFMQRALKMKPTTAY